MPPSSPSITERQVEVVLQDWPREPTGVAEGLLDRYGPPDAVTSQRLVWHENDPWKRTVLNRECVPHEFPGPHLDYLEQVLDYHVPPEYCEALCRFNGSVVVRRTHGEIAVCCRNEPTNVLIANLVHDVITDEKTAAEARATMTEAYARLEAGGRPEYCQRLQFDVADVDQRDPGETTLTESIREDAERRVE